jgi:hypothetical protein
LVPKGSIARTRQKYFPSGRVKFTSEDSIVYLFTFKMKLESLATTTR